MVTPLKRYQADTENTGLILQLAYRFNGLKSSEKAPPGVAGRILSRARANQKRSPPTPPDLPLVRGGAPYSPPCQGGGRGGLRIPAKQESTVEACTGKVTVELIIEGIQNLSTYSAHQNRIHFLPSPVRLLSFFFSRRQVPA